MTTKVTAVRVTPIAIKDPALLNAAGVHEPFGLRSIIEVVGANGEVGLGETYGDAPVLDLLNRTRDSLVGLSAFDTNGLWARVLANAPQTNTGHVEMELAPGSLGSNLINSAFSAFEVAFLDLQARTLGIPLVELLGVRCAARWLIRPTCSTSGTPQSTPSTRLIRTARPSIRSKSWPRPNR